MPWVVMGLCVVGLYGLLRHRVALARFVMMGVAVTYCSAAVVGWLCFPVSGRKPAVMAMTFGLFLLFVGWLSWRRIGRGRGAMLAGAVAGVLLGVVLPLTQRGADPATRPAEANHLELATGEPDRQPPGVMRLGDFASLSPRSAHINVEFGNVTVGIEPLLEFVSRSPDRCCTILAPRRHRVSPIRKLTGWGQTDESVTMGFDGVEPAVLRIGPPEANALQLEANTSLPSPVYSHLNSYCVMDVYGHKRLFLAFSPCPEGRVEVMYSQYPIGRPARMAYLDAAGVFHVVEASSGEKGPFKTLAQGPLARDEALSITFYDEDTAVGRITFDDFAAQASTQPSPTAGWGVPENAIEFKLFADRPDATAGIWVTLAGTSVGRGWDSVGHAAGVYRNRMRIEVLGDRP